MTELYLVRHGETDWNRERRIQGRTDIPLNDTGRAQARSTAGLLATQAWDAVLTSPLLRARETAEIIGARLGIAPESLDLLIERNYGEAEGCTDAELDERFPGERTPSGRESREEVVARVLPALELLSRERRGQRIVVVSHGGVIRSLLLAIEPVGGVHESEPITNGSVHSLRWEDGGLRLLQFDDPLETSTLGDLETDIERQNAIEGREATLR